MPARTLSEIAELCGATVDGDGSRLVVGPAALSQARPDEISFLAHPKYERELALTRAAGVLVRPDVASPRGDLCLLRCEDPSASFTAVVRAFSVELAPPEPGIHASAVVHPTAELGEGVSIGALCVVGVGARIGARSILHPHVVIGAGAKVGEDCAFHPGVRLYPGVTIGDRCIFHAGCVVGSDGFGFEPGQAGWSKIPQCGTVQIGDDVEVGANATIDRGRFGATSIGRGAKIDNLVHVAHNCVIGAGSLLCAQVGLAGSAKVGRNVVLGGQVGVAGHVTIGDGSRVAAQGAVFGDLPAHGDYLGFPARPRAEALKSLAYPQRVAKWIERVRDLERRLARFEGGDS